MDKRAILENESHPMNLKAWRSTALDWVFPSKCALCGFLDKGSICASCLGEMEAANTIVEIDGIAFAHSIYRYEGRSAQAVRRLKYERITSLAKPMAQMMRDALDSEFPDFDLIVPVPIHLSRRCLRGFNQAELLCEAMDQELVDRRLLRRRTATRPQVGLSPEQRMTNLIGAFQATRSLDRDRIVLVDDVTTSGHTAQECAKSLLQAGASKVMLLTFASGS